MSGIDAVLALARPEIRALTPYAHASWEPALTRLHANELPWAQRSDADGDLNRYPEPQPAELLAALADYLGVAPAQILATHGSDEAIDLLTRAFCRAGEDAVVVTPPTFGMFAVAARVQGAAVREVALRPPDFALDAAVVIAALKARTRIVWLCSPNNPTGAWLPDEVLRPIVAAARGRALVVIDEAYAEFSSQASRIAWLAAEPHVVVLRTLSKAHALAGARIGAAVAQPEIIALLRRIVPPYNLARCSIRAALAALQPAALAATGARVREIVAARAEVANALRGSPDIERVWPSDANFLLVRCCPGASLFERWVDASLLVRDFRRSPRLENCLRITIGDPDQNRRLLAVSGRTA